MARSIAKPFRLRTRSGELIAMSGPMFDKISSRVTRLNGVFVARRGEYDGVFADLEKAVWEHHDHFNEKSRDILGFFVQQKAA